MLPVEWMATAHRGLGLGELPRTPIVEYLARSVSALYGFHGIVLWIVSGDPMRYRTILWYVASMNVVFGLAMVAIDAVAGMPLLWTIGEGPPLIAVGVLIGILIRSLPAPIAPMGSGPVSHWAAESGATAPPAPSRGSGVCTRRAGRPRSGEPAAQAAQYSGYDGSVLACRFESRTVSGETIFLRLPVWQPRSHASSA